MTARSKFFHGCVGIVASLAFGVATSHSNGDSTLVAEQNRVEPLLQSVAVGKDLQTGCKNSKAQLFIAVWYRWPGGA